MRKLWTIAWKELYTTFTDRNLILIMIATPLAISTIVGLAFGGLGGGDAPIRDIPALVVNHDQGGDIGVNYGDVYISLLVPEAGGARGSGDSLPECSLTGESTASQDAEQGDLQVLTDAEAFELADARALVGAGTIPEPQAEPGSDEYLDAAARAAVESGAYAAAIIIPANFTQRLTYSPASPELERVEVTVYGNPGRPVSAGIIRSIAEGITNQIATGSIAINATLSEFQQQFGGETLAQMAGSLDFQETFACAFSPQANTIQIDRQPVESGSQDDNFAGIILVSVGSSQAMFFALFTAQFGVLSMYDERRNWTLQRLIVSPTPRGLILGGKLVGVFVTVLFQLIALFLALTLVGSLMQGELSLIWGSQLPLIGVVLVAASLAVSGLGMLMAGIVKSPEQAQVFNSVLNIGLAVLGGAFGFALPEGISQLSLVYWGRDAFDRLAAGQSDVWLNVLVLVAQGIVMFGIGLLLFNRRFDNVAGN